jgi:hypothetical protein
MWRYVLHFYTSSRLARSHFRCMRHQMRRIGIVPPCNLDQSARLPVLVQRLDYVRPLSSMKNVDVLIKPESTH